MKATFKIVAPEVLLKHSAIITATVCIPVTFYAGVAFLFSDNRWFQNKCFCQDRVFVKCWEPTFAIKVLKRAKQRNLTDTCLFRILYPPVLVNKTPARAC